MVRDCWDVNLAEIAAPFPLERERREKVQLDRVALPQSFSPPLILTAGDERETESVACEDAISTDERRRSPLWT